MIRNFLLIITLFFIYACSTTDGKYNSSSFGSRKAPSTYIVKKGDTIFSIAWIYGLNPKDIQRKNHLSNPNRIFVGQRLYLRNVKKGSIAENRHQAKQIGKKVYPSKRRTQSYTQPRVIANWVWPMKGSVLRNFNPNKIGANGIRIAGKTNQAVSAAESGVVAYKGNGLNGFGNVIIIKHNNGLLSVYGFLSKTYVKKGQRVKKRQRIGRVGVAANKQRMLHFEVRRNGKPVNPKAYIGNSYRF